MKLLSLPRESACENLIGFEQFEFGMNFTPFFYEIRKTRTLSMLSIQNVHQSQFTHLQRHNIILRILI